MVTDNKDKLDHLQRQNKLQSQQVNWKRSAPIGLWDRFPTARTEQQMMDTMESLMEDPLGYGGCRWASSPADLAEYRRGRTPWEIKESDSVYKIRFVKVWIEEKMLVVKAEKLTRSEHNGEENGEEWSGKIYGKYNFRIALPENVEFEKIKTKDGVLYITIPKATSTAKVFDINVE